MPKQSAHIGGRNRPAAIEESHDEDQQCRRARHRRQSGLSEAFAKALLEAGASKVYAAARDHSTIALEGTERVKLDVTRPEDVSTAADRCRDVTLLINNAGIARGSTFLSPESAAIARSEIDTNFFGPLAMCQAFAPVLAANGGGSIVNVLSVLSWINLGGGATYSASKSAAWSLTNGLRNELRFQGTQVLGLHVAFMDTDMTKGRDGPKANPADVVRQTLNALEQGQVEVLADEVTRQVKRGLSAARGIYLGEPAV